MRKAKLREFYLGIPRINMVYENPLVTLISREYCIGGLYQDIMPRS